MGSPYAHASPKLLCIATIVALGATFPFAFQSAFIRTGGHLAFRNFINSSSISDDQHSVFIARMLNENCGNFVTLLCVWFAPFISERFGRRKALLFSNMFALLGTALQCSYTFLYYPEIWVTIAQCITGIHFGLNLVLLPLFLSEISPAEVRGLVCSLQELSIAFATAVGSIVVVGNLAYSWFPIVFAVSFIFIILQSIVLIWAPDTPRHLFITKGQTDETLKALAFFHGKNANVEKEIESMIAELEANISSRSLKIALFVGTIALSSRAFSGVDTARERVTPLFASIGLSETISTVVPSTINFLAVATSLFLVDTIRRRSLLIGSLLICVCCNIAQFLISVGSRVNLSTTISLDLLLFIAFGFGAALPRFLLTETVPQWRRSSAQSTAVGCATAIDVVTSLTFIYVHRSFGSSFGILLCFVLPSLFLCLPVLSARMPETGRREVVDVVNDLEEDVKVGRSDASRDELRPLLHGILRI